MVKSVNKDEINTLVEALNKEEIIAFPTETVYGLGIVYDSKLAYERLIKAKRRPETKPFTIMISNKEDISKFAIVTKRDQKIIDRMLPGALTLILNKKDGIDEMLTNGYPTVGIRMPDDEFVLNLIDACGKPLLVPSANISGEPPAKTSDEVLSSMEGISVVVKGKCGSGTPSTIVDLTQPEIRIIRQGSITLEEIEEALL